MNQTKFYGLTGGIGAGKSTVAKMFKDLIIPVLDLDKVGHIILEQDSIVKTELIQTFGEIILNSDKSINRKNLANLAFSSARNTSTLNNILHPRIQTYESQWRSKQSTPFAIIEASVLIESGDISRMGGLIVVLADTDIRKARVLARGKQSEASFQAIFNQQCSDEERALAADYILHNNSDTQALHNNVNRLYQKLTSRNSQPQ